jgi:hypothetical protein
MMIFLDLVINYMTKKDETPVDDSHISPVSHFLLPEADESQYRDVESALRILEADSTSKVIILLFSNCANLAYMRYL